MLRRLVPHPIRQAVRRYRHARAIRKGCFADDDPLFYRISDWVHEGDTALDVGAAVGTYTVALSDLVGTNGRVIALEPMPDQFEVLVANLAGRVNVTCLQLAAGRSAAALHMSVPNLHGVPNWYEARISDVGTPILCVALDNLPLPSPVRFIKIDCEGHDFAVLEGAERIIARDRPTLYMEAHDSDVTDWLRARGYEGPVTAGGANGLYHPHRRAHSTD